MPSEDMDKFTPIANLMGQDLGFPVGQIYHIIYPAPGSSADYWYWKKKTVALGLEIGGGGFAPRRASSLRSSRSMSRRCFTLSKGFREGGAGTCRCEGRKAERSNLRALNAKLSSVLLQDCEGCFALLAMTIGGTNLNARTAAPGADTDRLYSPATRYRAEC